jgi:hypothetical protein
MLARVKIPIMADAKDTLEATRLEMRWRVLSLAADFDRIERSRGGAALLESDPTIGHLRRAMRAILEEKGNRAEKVQMIFSDLSAPPARPAKGRQ